MTAWMLHGAGVAGLVTLAAGLLEASLRGLGHSGRWVWALALLLSLAIPAAAVLRASPGAPPEASVVRMGGTYTGGPADDASIRPEHWWDRVPAGVEKAGAFLLPAWVVATTSMLALLLVGTTALHRRAARWPRAQLPQGEFLISERFGPAIIAGLRPRVVVPRWAVALGRGAMDMILAHEEEHRRTGDANLLLAGAAAVALAPWNPFLWLQLRRLRCAVELDCDGRVLRRGVSPAPYAELLLELGRRPRERWVPWAALAAEPSLLERRLTMIVRGNENMGRRRAVLAASLSAALVALACGAEAPPLSPQEPDAAEQFGKQALAVGAATEGKPASAGGFAGKVASVLPVGSAPLIFLDGEEVTKEALQGLDKDAIERVEVIKGPAALALLGPRAEGGVIRIFLKDGGEGPGGGPTSW